ncbi:MAG: hypothetical protein IJS61_00850 [Firmicutes bacterium]|nr:hypothetical protein [Bacillota bacterium]
MFSLWKKNSSINKNINIEGFANGQALGKLKDLRLGFFKAEYNGCGAIALYNICKLLSIKKDIGEVFDYCNHRALFFWGMFGTKPVKLGDFLEKQGFKVTRGYKKGKKNTPALVTYWHRNIFKGKHTVALYIGEDFVKVYNFYGNVEKAYTFKNMEEFFEKAEAVHPFVQYVEGLKEGE